MSLVSASRPFRVRSRGIPRLDSHHRTRPCGLLGAIVVSAAAFFVAPPTVTATPITYTLSNATATFSAPDPVGIITLTGTFTEDLSGPTLNSVNITTSGPPGFLLFEPLTFTIPAQTNSLSQISATTGPGGFLIEIDFKSPLDPTASSDLGRVLIQTILHPFPISTSMTTGSAVPTTTPEPASLTLLGGALGLFLLTRRAKWRGCRA
jgi:hypothetical protein